MNRRTLAVAAVGTLTLAVFGAGFAGAAKKLKNGGFESGDFNGWTVDNLDSPSDNTWYVYSGTTTPQEDDQISAPPQGEFAAITDGGAATRILYRTLRLAKNKKHTLKMRVYYDNQNGAFFTPESLDWAGTPNQQYRIDVLRRRAPIDSLDDSDILKEVFATEVGDPASLAPTRIGAKLTKFAGKKVKLRLAEVDNQFFFHAGVDGVKLKSKPKK
jgi:hypothetical protein